MRRWNGWGDDTISYHVPAQAVQFLAALVGPGQPPRDAAAGETLGSLPPARPLDHPLIRSEPVERLRHAAGQSFPDWIALRSGRIAAFPDGVAYPTTDADVADLIRFAQAAGAQLIPYGGGTSVVGHINPLSGGEGRPVLTVDMSRMNRLLRLDDASHLATFGAGVAGPDLEAQLRARGYTLGHFPQSFEYSTLGGWIATRSSGQESLGYGRIEDLFAGGRLLSPAGELALPPFPASAAGPDLRHLVLGSEGRLGIITEATVRVSSLADHERLAVHALFLPDWNSAQTAARQIVQAGLPLSLMRLSTPTETETTLTLAGHERLIGALQRLVSLRGVRDGKCMLMLGFSSREAVAKAARGEALDIAGQHGGVNVGRAFGSQWYKNRFRTPYLRNALWELGYGVDTVETATTWGNVSPMVEAIENALHKALLPFEERVHAFTHLSHFYSSGCSVYTTFLFRLADSPGETLARWQALKAAASQAITGLHGTISHQHGVGADHAAWLPAEKGELGMALLHDAVRRFDPEGIMNPGKLLST
jgi:alkyldihydroxyacetonephosphate synthase